MTIRVKGTRKTADEIREQIETRFEVKFASTSVKTACFLWTGSKSKGGYGNIYVGTSPDNKRIVRAVHCVAYELAHGPIPKGHDVGHLCDVRNCIRPSHLKAMTPQENAQDMHGKGRANTARGENASAAKLTWAQVRAIRAEYSYKHRNQYTGKNPCSFTSLGKKYGVEAKAISDIITRKSWNHEPETTQEKAA